MWMMKIGLWLHQIKAIQAAAEVQPILTITVIVVENGNALGEAVINQNTRKLRILLQQSQHPPAVGAKQPLPERPKLQPLKVRVAAGIGLSPRNKVYFYSLYFI